MEIPCINKVILSYLILSYTTLLVMEMAICSLWLMKYQLLNNAQQLLNNY